MRTFQIVIAPLHVVQLGCDDMQQTGNILEFFKEGDLVASFQAYMGWLEVFPAASAEGGERAQVLRLVPNGEPAITMPEPISPDPAA